MVARAAHLGEEGDVDGALEATKQADAIARQHDALYKQLTEPERTMTVCEICGVFINSTDNDQRRLVSAAGCKKRI
jgi:ATP/maltotriose-dependent transcriptional regulator MalT